jgi:expansin (peptidoglycan-binding protein)
LGVSLNLQGCACRCKGGWHSVYMVKGWGRVISGGYSGGVTVRDPVSGRWEIHDVNRIHESPGYFSMAII